MRVSWMFPVSLLALTGCDDTLFGGDVVVEGEGYDAVVDVFDANCVSCHSDATASSFGNLSLEGDLCELVGVEAFGGYDDSNGDRVLLIAAGDAEASLIWHKAEDSGTYGGVMPTTGRMDQANIDIIANWINDDSAGDCAR